MIHSHFTDACSIMYPAIKCNLYDPVAKELNSYLWHSLSDSLASSLVFVALSGLELDGIQRLTSAEGIGSMSCQ
jgi:hypothetical protein